MVSVVLRKAKKSEIDKLIQFLKENWKEDHIFVRRPELLLWQHDSDSDELNIVIAVDSSTGGIFAFHGFIPASRFDRHLPEREISLAIWKALPHPEAMALGLQTQFFMERNLKADSISAIGLEEGARQLYQALRYELGRLDQFYILHPSAPAEGLTIKALHSSPKPLTEPMLVRPLGECDPARWASLFESYNQIYAPTKSFEFFMNRYLRHPAYQYRCDAIEISGCPVGIVASRLCVAEGSKALRIVDLIFKDHLDWLASYAYELLMFTGAEYIDFYNHGLQDLIQDTGWILRAGEAVIPNYFEPFQRRNVNLDYALRNRTKRHFVLVKGDGDQDRPSF